MRVEPGHELLDDLDDSGPVADTGRYQQTKNEIPTMKVTIPDIEEIGMEETLEKVGEIMSIVDTVVIVRGMATENLNRASETALDADTLFVFDDRKVLGYVRLLPVAPSDSDRCTRFTKHLAQPTNHSTK